MSSSIDGAVPFQSFSLVPTQTWLQRMLQRANSLKSTASVFAKARYVNSEQRFSDSSNLGDVSTASCVAAATGTTTDIHNMLRWLSNELPAAVLYTRER